MKKLVFAFTCFLLTIVANAHELDGFVTDQKGAPLIGVNIFNRSTGEYTYSKAQGAFIVQQVAIGDTLQFSHLGFETKRHVVLDLGEPLTIALGTQAISLDEIVIQPKIDALNLIAAIDIKTNPVNSSQDVLRQVPGLFIGQHAGGGKAEQIFLRGFDIDHGTDINITVDGLPVNMVSHAHGQGYADLHFVIPETIQKIDFGKGPYYANQGNFTTAGYVAFKTKERLDNNLIKVEGGRFNTSRVLGLYEFLDNQKNNGYIAAEYQISDGPFQSSQDFDRLNLFGKFSSNLTKKDRLGVSASYFRSSWDASGQIPQRAVDSGLISRFGAIDDTEGGFTDRTNASLSYERDLDHHSFITTKAYYVNYNFELFSNFTFFLNDPINGDQIRQHENRNIYGLNSEYNRDFFSKGLEGNFQAGISIRSDHSRDNELSRTANRSETLTRLQFGDVDELNVGTYVNATFNAGKWTFNPAVRIDFFNFSYDDALLNTSGNEQDAIFSPKLNILYNQTSSLQWYLKGGRGFHSNDSRGVVAQSAQNTLPAAYGGDFGLIWKPVPRLIVNTAYWSLFLEQEFVYVGDEGIVEASGKTLRQGVEASVRYQLTDRLFWNADATYTLARSREEADGEDFIPLAPDFALVSGISIAYPWGLRGGLNLRYLDDRPANEDNSIVAEGYTVVDLNVGYAWKKFDLSLQIQNLFNADWNETQFATESRLQDEANSVEEIHFTPGTPFNFRFALGYSF